MFQFPPHIFFSRNFDIISNNFPGSVNMLIIIALLQNCKPIAVFNFTLFLNCHIIQLLETEFYQMKFLQCSIISWQSLPNFSKHLTVFSTTVSNKFWLQSVCVFSQEQSQCIMKSWVCNGTSYETYTKCKNISLSHSYITRQPTEIIKIYF